MASDAIKNIAIVSNTSWYIYNFRKGLLQKLIGAGYTVFAIAPKDKFVEEITNLGCTFIELKHIHNKSKNPFQDILLTLELRKILKVTKLDFCFFFTPKINIYGSIAAKFTKTKTVATINGLGFVFSDGQPGWLKFTVKKLYTIAFKNLKAVIFQNTDDKQYFLDFKIVDSSQQIIVVRGSGANLIEFDQKKSFNSGSNLVFLLSARLIKEKGLFEYFEAAKQLKQRHPNVTFAVLGLKADNPSAVPVSVIDALHQQKIIKYWGGTDNMSAMLNNVDVMVLPSYYREGVPKILIEALAKGLPVITTDNIGCRETVEDGKNGFLIEVKNAIALEAAMEKMILMKTEQLAKLGENSRNKAEREFDEAFNHKTYLTVLNS